MYPHWKLRFEMLSVNVLGKSRNISIVVRTSSKVQAIDKSKSVCHDVQNKNSQSAIDYYFDKLFNLHIHITQEQEPGRTYLKEADKQLQM